MTDITTEAGKRLLNEEARAWLWEMTVEAYHGHPLEGCSDPACANAREYLDDAIAAVEAEAVAAERERIRLALRAQPTPPRLFALSAWDLDCVLIIVNDLHTEGEDWAKQ